MSLTPTEEKEHLHLQQLVKMFNSRTGFLTLLILTISTVALFLRFLDSPSYAAIISTIGGFFHWSHSKMQTLSAQLSLSPPSQIQDKGPTQ